jgi:hypothetical protein
MSEISTYENHRSGVKYYWAYIGIVYANEAIFPVRHDLRVHDLHFSSPSIYIDNQDFLRENGEVGLVLGIRERP